MQSRDPDVIKSNGLTANSSGDLEDLDDVDSDDYADLDFLGEADPIERQPSAR